MSLIPLDKSGEVSLYNNNQHVTRYNPSILDANYSARREFPIDPKNDLIPPAFASPMSDMNMGPPEQDMKSYFSLTIDDINQYQKEKIKKQIKIYEKILGNCNRRVREYVMKDQRYTFYTIPEYMPGFPLYDITKCSYFLIKKLKENGFETKFIPPKTIYIHWSFPKKITHDSNKDNTMSRPVLKKQSDVHRIRLDNVEDNQMVRFQSEPVLNKYTTQHEEQFLFA